MDADQLDLGRKPARNIRAQIALAVDPMAIPAQRLHAHDAGDRGKPLGNPRSSLGPRRLDIDDMAPAEDPAGEFGYGARQRDAAPVEQGDAVADALHLIEMVRR